MLQLSKAGVLDPIMGLARRYPHIEVTGLVAQRADGGMRVIPMQNIAKDPTAYYEWEPKEMAEVWSRMDANGEEPVMVYHSHPGGRPHPSERDMEGALFVGLHHLIVYLHASGEWSYTSWECIEYGILVGAELEIVT